MRANFYWCGDGLEVEGDLLADEYEGIEFDQITFRIDNVGEFVEWMKDDPKYKEVMHKLNGRYP